MTEIEPRALLDLARAHFRHKNKKEGEPKILQTVKIAATGELC